MLQLYFIIYSLSLRVPDDDYGDQGLIRALYVTSVCPPAQNAGGKNRSKPLLARQILDNRPDAVFTGLSDDANYLARMDAWVDVI